MAKQEIVKENGNARWKNWLLKGAVIVADILCVAIAAFCSYMLFSYTKNGFNITAYAWYWLAANAVLVVAAGFLFLG